MPTVSLPIVNLSPSHRQHGILTLPPPTLHPHSKRLRWSLCLRTPSIWLKWETIIWSPFFHSWSRTLRAFFSRSLEFLSRSLLLDLNQYVFKSSYSRENVLLSLMIHYKFPMSCSVFGSLDLSAAFDTDNHRTVSFSPFSLAWASLVVYSPGLNLTYRCFHSGCCGKVSFWLLTSSTRIGAGAAALYHKHDCWGQSSTLMFLHTTLQMISCSTCQFPRMNLTCQTK